MAKKIQKKQIEDGVFVETKATYSAPTQDNEFVQKKYVDEEVAKKADISHTHSWVDITNKPHISVTLADTAISRTYTIGLTGANGSSGKLIIPKAVSWNDVTDKPTFPTLPSWVTQTKPTYDWSEIQNKPEIDIELKYKRLTEVTGNITDLLKDKPGVFRVGDSARLQGMPDGDWYHFFGGRHGNWSEQRNFYFALKSHEINNYFWVGKQNNTENVEWFKFIGLKDLANNKLFREWNLEHGLSAYIGNSNVFNVRTGFSGEASHLLFSLDTEKTYFSKFIVTDGSGILFKDKTQIHVRDNGNIVFGNKPFNDLVIGEFKGIQLWGQGNDKVVLAGGGVKDISELKNENNLIEKTITNNEKVLESKGELPIKTRRNILTNNSGSRINLETLGNELTVTTHSGWARVQSNGYKIQGKDDNSVLTAGGNSKPLTQMFNDWYSTQGANIGTINTFKAYNNGTHKVDITGEGGILSVFKTNSSASSIELLVPGYGAHRLHFTHSIDNNRYAHPFKELAYFEDVYRPGIIRYDWDATKEHQNNTVFVNQSGYIELNQLENLSSMSFRKVFSNGSVEFRCSGKQIIYTGDNQFNGKDGSTAVVSIYENKCYIDIRNI